MSIYIYKSKRTATGKFLGSFKNTSAGDMGSLVLKEIISACRLDPKRIDEVIIGNVLSANLGQNVARQVAYNAGVPYEVCAYAVNMVCGSGMKAVINGFNSITAGQADTIVVGGTENMSRAPYLLTSEVRTGIKLGNDVMTDHILRDALSDAFLGIHMGITGENVAEKYRISREDQDEFAYRSHKKAAKAVDDGCFIDEIVSIDIPVGKDKFETISRDEGIRRDTSVEKLSKLKPAFKADGTVTPGNASTINDGAAVLLLGNEQIGKDFNLEPETEIIQVAQCGVPLEIMGMGAFAAIHTLMNKVDISFSDVGLIEINEAFAAQSLGVIRKLVQFYKRDIDELMNIINVNGGAIALGHPVGASGARILTTLSHTMVSKNVKYGIASICIGGGMGTSVLLRNPRVM